MIARILVPLDGSPLAEQALPCAVTLARELPAELVLLRAIWIPPDILQMLDETTLEGAAIVGQLDEQARNYLDTLVGQLTAAGVTARSELQRGPAAEIILGYARQASIDQIVMSTHGYSGFKRWTHGSVAERVLQAAPVPLLLVRVEQDQEGDWRRPARCQRILTLLDGSAAAEQILPTVAVVARAMQGQMILFQVPVIPAAAWIPGEWGLLPVDLPETAKENAQAYLDEVALRLDAQGLRVATATAIGPTADCIVEYAEANNIDLIAMCTHGRTGVVRWALGSVADRVVRAGTKPVLLVRCYDAAPVTRLDQDEAIWVE